MFFLAGIYLEKIWNPGDKNRCNTAMGMLGDIFNLFMTEVPTI